MSSPYSQFEACVRNLIPLASRAEFSSRLPEVKAEVESWSADFAADVAGGKLSYPKAGIRQTPDLEDRAVAIAYKLGITAAPVKAEWKPTICLSHDVDYLKPTLQMHLKRVIASRRVGFSAPENFIDSMQQMLEEESRVCGKLGTTTVFLALKSRAPGRKQRLTQWLIDPSYTADDPLFKRLVDLLRAHQCEVGIHGSLYSLEESLLGSEMQRLESAVGSKIKVSRQHWLNLPGSEPLARLRAFGIAADSTLGWNGNVGFRGGMARPFPLLTSAGLLWEVPMAVMDGPMFDDLRLSSDQAVELSKNLLTEVFDRRGCVAINWHDRAAHPEYNWFGAYAEVLKWAKAKGFHFSTVGQVISEYEEAYHA